MRDTEGNILQLHYKDDPWKVLVVCMLLNRTTRTHVEKVVDVLFKAFPTPYHLAHAHYKPDEWTKLCHILKPLGLCTIRAKRLNKFANDVLDKGISPLTIDKIYGIGPYAKDCYMIMYHGQRHLTCTDGALINYLNRVNSSSSEI